MTLLLGTYSTAAAPQLIDYDSPAFWYDFRPAYTTVDTGDISAAADRFELATTLAQGTASKRPASDSNALGTGFPGGGFDGVDEVLGHSSGGALTGSVWTMYCVIRPSSLPASGAGHSIYSEKKNAAARTLGPQLYNNAGTSRYEFAYDVAGTVSVPRGSTAPDTTNGVVLVCQHGASADKMWVNTTAQSISYRAGSFVAGAMSLSGAVVAGALDNGTEQRYWHGGIGALVGYNAEHSSADVASIVSLLTAEYL